MDSPFYRKYLKYKGKYLALKGGMVGGAGEENSSSLFYNKQTGGSKELIDAAREGDLDRVKALVGQQGVDVNMFDNPDGMNPLLAAAIFGHLPVVKYLVETGKANINVAQSTYPNTPLYMAALNAEYDIVVYLIEKGAIIDERMKTKWSRPLRRDFGESNESWENRQKIKQYLDNKLKQ